MTDVLIRREKFEDTQGRKLWGKWKQSLESCGHKPRIQGLPATTRRRKRQGRILPRGLQRDHGALPITWFQTSGLQSCERIDFCCFKPPKSVEICYSGPRNLRHFVGYQIFLLHYWLLFLSLLSWPLNLGVPQVEDLEPFFNYCSTDATERSDPGPWLPYHLCGDEPHCIMCLWCPKWNPWSHPKPTPSFLLLRSEQSIPPIPQVISSAPTTEFTGKCCWICLENTSRMQPHSPPASLPHRWVATILFTWMNYSSSLLVSLLLFSA